MGGESARRVFPLGACVLFCASAWLCMCTCICVRASLSVCPWMCLCTCCSLCVCVRVCVRMCVRTSVALPRMPTMSRAPTTISIEPIRNIKMASRMDRTGSCTERERDRQTEPRRHVDSTMSTFLCVDVYMRVPMFECAYGGAARTRRQSAQPTGLSVSLSISYLSQAINTCERGLAYVRACVRAVCARRRTLSLSLSLSRSPRACEAVSRVCAPWAWAAGIGRQ
jgi:hypothetical protein